MLGPLSGQVNITEQLHVMTTKHIHNSIVHCNSIARLVANRALHCARSPKGQMWHNLGVNVELISPLHQKLISMVSTR